MIEPVAHLTILMIELREIEPRLWRRVDEPLSSALLTLHDIIQVAFLSTNSHLCEFVVGEHVYGEPMPDDDFFDRNVHKAAGVRLKARIERGVERCLSVYDFGDDWWHDIFPGIGRGWRGRCPTSRRSSTASGGARRRTSAASPASFTSPIEPVSNWSRCRPCGRQPSARERPAAAPLTRPLSHASMFCRSRKPSMGGTLDRPGESGAIRAPIAHGIEHDNPSSMWCHQEFRGFLGDPGIPLRTRRFFCNSFLISSLREQRRQSFPVSFTIRTWTGRDFAGPPEPFREPRTRDHEPRTLRLAFVPQR